MGLLSGKNGLVMGVTNDRSIAWAMSQALWAEGAELAFTHLERLQELGLSPFTVERRPLSVYAEVANGDR